MIFLFVVFSLFTYLNTFEGLENNLQDRYLQNNKNKQIDTRVVVVGIDEESLEQIGQWPWPRSFHGALVEIISQGKPSVIGFDIIFSEPDPNPEEDAIFVEAVKNNGSVVIPVYGIFEEKVKAGEMKTEELIEPFHDLKEVSYQGHINTFPDKDGVIRRTVLYFDYQGKRIESFAWTLHKNYMEKNGQEPKIEEMPLDMGNRMLVDFSGRPGNVEYVSYASVLIGEVPPEYFEDKIVLVGPYGMGIDDMYLTSMDHGTPMHGVEIHANIIQNLLKGNYKQPVSFFISFIILLLFSIFGFVLFRKYPPGWMLALLIGVIMIYISIVKRCYESNIVLPIVYPIMLLSFTYIFTIALRYIQELIERKRVTDVFGRYVAPQVVDKILNEGQEGLKLGGTRKEISVLFVDIRGFTPLSEKADPEEIVEILNSYLNLCAESIFTYGGTLDKFIGDATMAIFNAPLDLEDHAFKAVQTAWKMKEGSKELKDKLFERYGRTVEFGIGVNTGIAVIGNIGAQVRMDYTAIGDTVNTSARLESNAKPGQILISEATYERVKDRVEVIALGEIKVKGKAQGIPVYQLEGIK
jgi:adenylate cyclase